jgi:hypothetical protein
VDSKQNVGIPWNSDRIQLAGASAILVSNSMEIPTESDGIQWKLLESGSLQEQFPLESIGIPFRFQGIPMESTFQFNSNGFQEILTDSNGVKCLLLLLTY